MRKRLVRVHLAGDLPSVEGLLTTYRTSLSGGHYVVELANLMDDDGTGGTRSVELEGGRVRVPRERVAFIQEMK